jgi:protein TonB
MTLTIDNPPDLNGPGKPGTSSEKSANGSGKSSRSNPVCLEANLTIRSLPGEMGGLTQPFREDARTVIVFDNGAVIRSTSSFPVGQKIILSNAAGREVVCRVAAGRNMPNIKGYVELEFLEAVNDFWSIHQARNSANAVAPASAQPSVTQSATPPVPAVPPVVRAADPAAIPFKQASVIANASPSIGNGPTFGDIPGLISMPISAPASEPTPTPEKSGRDVKPQDASVAAAPASAGSAAPVNRRSAVPQTSPAASENAANAETLSITSPAPPAARDFMSRGLMAYEQPAAVAASTGRTPLIIGVGAVVLAVACGVVYFNQRQSTSEPAMNMSALTRPVTPLAPAAGSTPSPTPATPADATSAVAPSQDQPVPVAAEAVREAVPPAVPAVVTSAVVPDSHADARTSAANLRRPEKATAPGNPADGAASRRPAIPNLKMSTPSAPNKNAANGGAGAAAMTEISAPEAMGGTPSAGLLTSAGRISNPPAAPPSAPAPVVTAPVAPAPAPIAKVLRDPKLISSTRPEYPAAARQSRVQGDVTVLVDVDATGKVTAAKALSGPPLLRPAAVESVRQWKYAPGSTDGTPAPSQVTVNVAFRLN